MNDENDDEFDSRHSTTRTEDREAFVPDDAEPFIDPDGPTPGYALFGNLYLTDDAIYSTGGPINLSAMSSDTGAEASAPALGADTQRLLIEELGYESEHVAKLREQGVI